VLLIIATLPSEAGLPNENILQDKSKLENGFAGKMDFANL
jgi:hypothetical protein